jgi:3-methyladenine DNA glycosylase AlkD
MVFPLPATGALTNFFIRMVIGCALGEFSKTVPERVQDFVEAQPGRFPDLCIRETLKVIERQAPWC